MSDREEIKLRNQVGLLTNQVASLKQIIEIMEKETSRGAVGGNNEASSYLESETKQNKLLERWRKEVFDGLLRNKRYELLIKDNLARYTKELDALKTELKSAKNETALNKNKISVLENEASFN